ncbi:hypothetical protein [Candidatus Lokiarchaeum ossiferum]|uniref:hypothetical protein n=1 Tax=Candidatus Lokiarchaeum ossiferum TaxID=2951803 RepID=UPI00352EE3FE
MKIKKKTVMKILTSIFLMSILNSGTFALGRIIMPDPPVPVEEAPIFTTIPSDSSIDIRQTRTLTWKASSTDNQANRVAKIFKGTTKVKQIDDWANGASLSYTYNPSSTGSSSFYCLIYDSFGSKTDYVTVSVTAPSLSFTLIPTNSYSISTGESLSLTWKATSSPVISYNYRMTQIYKGSSVVKSIFAWENNEALTYQFSSSSSGVFTMRCSVSDGWNTKNDYVTINVLNDADGDGISDDREINILKTDENNEYSPLGHHYEDIAVGTLPSDFTYGDQNDFSLVNKETEFLERNPGNCLEISPGSYFQDQDLGVDSYQWYESTPVLIQFDFGILGSVTDPLIYLDLQDRSSSAEFFIEITKNNMKVCDSMNEYIDFYPDFNFEADVLYNFKLVMRKYDDATYSTEYLILINDMIYRFGVAYFITSPLNSMLFRFYGGGTGNFYFDNYFSDYLEGSNSGVATTVQTNRIYLNTLYNSGSSYVQPFMSYDEFTDTDVDVSVGLKVSAENIFNSGFGIEGGTSAFEGTIGSEDIEFGGGVDRISPVNEDLIVYQALEMDLYFYDLKIPGSSDILFRVPIGIQNIKWVFDATNFNTWNTWGEETPDSVTFSVADQDDYPDSFPWTSTSSLEKDYSLETYSDISSDSLEFGLSLPFFKNIEIGLSITVYTALILKVGARVSFPSAGQVNCDLWKGNNPESIYGLSTFSFTNVLFI